MKISERLKTELRRNFEKNLENFEEILRTLFIKFFKAFVEYFVKVSRTSRRYYRDTKKIFGEIFRKICKSIARESR